MFPLGGGAVNNGHVMEAVTKRDADEAIGNALRGIKGVRFDIVRSFSDPPPEVLGEAPRRKVARAKDPFRNSTVHFILDTHAITQELQETVFYELYGHAGLQIF
jgi:hypothetical protein